MSIIYSQTPPTKSCLCDNRVDPEGRNSNNPTAAATVSVSVEKRVMTRLAMAWYPGTDCHNEKSSVGTPRSLGSPNFASRELEKREFGYCVRGINDDGTTYEFGFVSTSSTRLRTRSREFLLVRVVVSFLGRIGIKKFELNSSLFAVSVILIKRSYTAIR